MMRFLGVSDHHVVVLTLVVFQLLWTADSLSFPSKKPFKLHTTSSSILGWLQQRSSPTLNNAFRPLSRLWINDSLMEEDFSLFDNTNNKTQTTLVQQALAMKARAQTLMAEARVLELELNRSRSKQQNNKLTELDEWIETLFLTSSPPENNNNINATATATTKRSIILADQLRTERWSPEQVLAVVDRIFERQVEAMGQTMSATTTPKKVFRIGSVQNVATVVNETETERLGDALNTLLEAVAILDKEEDDDDGNGNQNNNNNSRWTGRVEMAVRSRLRELRRTQEANLSRKVAAEINQIVATSSDSVEDYVRRTFGAAKAKGAVVDDNSKNNTTKNTTQKVSELLEKVALVPLWVPSAFLPLIITSEKLSTLGPEQVEAIKTNVLLGSRFYMTSSESVPGAALFRGNVRTLGGVTADDDDGRNQTALVFEDIQHRLEKQGLADKVQLFILPDPEFRYNREERELEAKPVLLALSKAITPDESKIEMGALVEIGKRLTYPLTLLTTLACSVSSYSLNPNFFESLVNQKDLTVLSACIPVFLGILSIQLLQEAAHYLVAKRRKIKIGFPVPIPSPQLGLFGCITPIRSFPSNRAALLDFALSGPLTSAVASLGCIVGGILLSARASPADIAHFPFIPAALFKSSAVVGGLTSWLASKALLVPLAQPVPVHPLFVVGYAGLMASALNLLPIFRLDGGRACSAAMGSRQGIVTSVSTLFFLLSLTLSGSSGMGFAWGMLVTIFQRRQEIPARDEVTEVNNLRLGAWFFSFLLSIAVLTPFPGGQGVL